MRCSAAVAPLGASATPAILVPPRSMPSFNTAGPADRAWRIVVGAVYPLLRPSTLGRGDPNGGTKRVSRARTIGHRREQQADRGAAPFATFDIDVAGALLHKTQDLAEPEAAAALPGGEERLECALQHRARHARAGVPHGDLRPGRGCGRRAAPDLDPARRLCLAQLEGDVPAPWHCILAVQHKVQERRLQLDWVDHAHQRSGAIKVEVDLDALAGCLSQDRCEAADERAEVGGAGAQLLASGEGQQAVDDVEG